MSTSHRLSDVLRVAPWGAIESDFITGKGRAAGLPDFPLDALGPFWKRFIIDAAGGGLPRDYFAANVLGTAAGLLGNARCAVFPAPSTQMIPPALWMINVGHPGAGKTPALDPFREIVDEIEASRATDIKVEDTTIAGVLNILTYAEHGIMVCDDELSGWWDGFKRDRGGEQFWLKAWNANAAYKVSRGGRGGGSYSIPRLAISVVGGAQPATLPTMLAATGGVERGFVSRCLFVFPNRPSAQETTGAHPDLEGAAVNLAKLFDLPTLETWQPQKLPVTKEAAAVHTQWWDRLNEQHFIDPLTPEGQWVMKQQGVSMRLALVLEHLWWCSATPPAPTAIQRARKLAALADAKRNSSFFEWEVAGDKLRAHCDEHGIDADDLGEGSAARALSRDGPRHVGARAVSTACALVEEYFFPHFRRCHEEAFTPPNVQAAIDLCKRLVRDKVQRFNARELRQYGLGKINPYLHGRAENVSEVCDFLADRNIIRRLATERTGRKPLDWEVNPRLSKQHLR